MTIDQASARQSAQTLVGLPTTQTQYPAKEDGKARQVIVVVAAIPGKRCLQIAQWGAPDGFQRNAAGLTKILTSIKLLGK
jgi:hypothetical protein